MKKIIIASVLIMLYITCVKSQNDMSLNEAISKSKDLTDNNWPLKDSSIARQIANTFIYNSVPENIKAKSLDYLNKATLIISVYSPYFNNMNGLVDEMKTGITEKDRQILEENIQIAFPELQDFSLWSCTKFLLKNHSKFPVYLANEIILKVIFGTPERNGDDGLFKWINCNVLEDKCFEAIAPMFDYYLLEYAPKTIVYDKKSIKFDDLCGAYGCYEEFLNNCKLAITKGYVFPEIDKINCKPK
ncbi:MAG TPA: hypothetical protein PKW80_01085 [Bacteroidales bacterium]|nr:hypothetical protein [Bacteroidales bacterium]